MKRMIWYVTRACMISTVMGLAACASAPEQHRSPTEEVGHVASKLWYQDITKLWTAEFGWPNQVIPLCWYDPIFSPPNNGPDWEDEKAFMKKVIAETWPVVANVDVTWSDYSDCGPDSSGSHVRVALRTGSTQLVNGQIVEFSAGSTKEGQRALKADSSPPDEDWDFAINVSSHWNDNEDETATLRQVITHEFGHLIGFAHEKDRSDDNDNTCTPLGNSVGTYLGPYDTNSITNLGYCGNQTFLTGADIRGVRAVYGARGPADTAYATPDPWSPQISGWCSSTGQTMGVADFNGDGYSDIYCRDPLNGTTRTWVALANGSGGFTINWTPWMSSWCGTTGSTFGVADFDGDGKSDFWCHDPIPGSGRTWIARSSGSGVTGNIWTPWASSWCASSGQSFSVSDVSGDGKADFICHDGPNQGGHTWVARSTGSGVTGGGGSIFTPWLTGWCGLGEHFGTADFDGDGVQDFWCHENAGQGRTWIAKSTGSGYTGSIFTPWSSAWCITNFGIGDFNGDGKADAYCTEFLDANSQGRVWVGLSNGSSFAVGNRPWISGFCNASGSSHGVADFNGDGRTDLWCHNATNTWTATSYGTWFDIEANTPKLVNWCTGSGMTFGGGDFDHTGAADFICHDATTAGNAGRVWTALTSTFYRNP